MKKLILFLTFIISGDALAEPGLEISLVNETIGAPAYNISGDPFNPSGNESNSAELNVILQNYQTYLYITKGSLSPKIHVGFASTNISGFITDLLASGIVATAVMSDMYTAAGMVTAQLSNAQIGIPVGFDNDVVVTNDDGLNSIFSNFHVFNDEQTYPSSSWESTLRYYTLSCHCNNDSLKSALDDYNSVIQATEYVSVGYLANTNFASLQAAVFPNPFSTTFSIQSNEKFTSYSIYDISGKRIIGTTSQSELDNQVQGLASGAYLLKLQSINGTTYNQKLIKK